MLNRPLAACRLVGLFAVLLLSACTATVTPLPIANPEVNVVWPQPPETPRIRLLRRFKGGADLVDQSAREKRLFRWMTGEMTESIPLIAPYAVATDGQGLIWVTDPGAHAVHFFDLKKRKDSLWLLAGDQFFASPVGLCYDSARHRVFVGDSLTKRIVVFSEKGQFLNELNVDPPFERPGGMAIDPQGNLLVVDVLAGKIRRFTPQGEELSALGSPTTPSGLFNRPTGLAVDEAGLIYVIDSLNFRIEVLTPRGEAVASIGEIGDQPGTLSRPRGVAVDSTGNIYVADAAFDNIQVFNLKGQLLLVFGGGGKNGLSMPANLVIDSSDRIYAVDSFNHQLQIYQFLGAPR